MVLAESPPAWASPSSPASPRVSSSPGTRRIADGRPQRRRTPGSSAIPSLSPFPSGSTTRCRQRLSLPRSPLRRSENPTPRPGPTTTPQPTPPGAWVSSGNMIDERQGHTATLLDDGTLLVIGGYTDQLECAPTVERYDPRSDRWADETELPDGMRCPHSATLLDDGTVLVDGGPAAATYDASRASWRAVGDHVVVRFQPSSTLLEDGSVLVAGGWVGESEGRPTASVESFDPTTRLWSAGPVMTQPRVSHVAVRLKDGSVLVAGGYSSPRIGTVASAETLDTDSQAWMRTSDMGNRRRSAAAVLLPNGRVLVVGGDSGDGVASPPRRCSIRPRSDGVQPDRCTSGASVLRSRCCRTAMCWSSAERLADPPRASPKRLSATIRRPAGGLSMRRWMGPVEDTRRRCSETGRFSSSAEKMIAPWC